MTLQDCVVQRIYRLLIQMDWTMEQLCTICRAFSFSLPEFFDAPMFQRLFLPETP